MLSKFKMGIDVTHSTIQEWGDAAMCALHWSGALSWVIACLVPVGSRIDFVTQNRSEKGLEKGWMDEWTDGWMDRWMDIEGFTGVVVEIAAPLGNCLMVSVFPV